MWRSIKIYSLIASILVISMAWVRLCSAHTPYVVEGEAAKIGHPPVRGRELSRCGEVILSRSSTCRDVVAKLGQPDDTFLGDYGRGTLYRYYIGDTSLSIQLEGTVAESSVKWVELNRTKPMTLLDKVFSCLPY